MLYIHILTINDFQGGVKCALVCVFFLKKYKIFVVLFLCCRGHIVHRNAQVLRLHCEGFQFNPLFISNPPQSIQM